MPMLYGALSTREQSRGGDPDVPRTRQDVAFILKTNDKMSRRRG
jgi:hypothetical protein